MTVAEAIAAATRQIDEELQRRWDALFLRLIEDGIDPSQSWVFDEQQRIDREWRADVLEGLRQRWVTH